MNAYAAQMEALLRNLGKLVKVCNPDGMELMFMSGASGCKHEHSSPLVARLQEQRSSYHTSNEAEAYLDGVFHKYAQDWQRGQEKRPYKHKRHSLHGLAERMRLLPDDTMSQISYFIFTDGVWQPNSQVSKPICQLLHNLQGSSKHQVAISFIQFGNDPIGTKRLRFLDEGLVETYGEAYGFERDVVDYERADGDVLKMILGPLDDWWDQVNESSTRDSREWYDDPGQQELEPVRSSGDEYR